MHKIIHIITRLDMGGSAQNTLQTCLGLNKDKYDVTLVYGLSLESKMTDEEILSVQRLVESGKKNSVSFICLPSLVRKIDPLKDAAALVFLICLLLKKRPEIVHTHTSKAGILGRLAAWFARVPVIIHTPHGHVFYGHFRANLTAFFLIIEKIMSLITRRIIMLTKGEKNDCIKLCLAPVKKIMTIHSGVDIDVFAGSGTDRNNIKNQLGLEPDNIVIGTVGWLLPIKGPKYLLKAMFRVWQDFPDVKLLFVGKGDLRIELETEAMKHGVLDKVFFAGWRDDVHEIMHVFDIFVLASLNEGMGRVIVEAMAAGKPVIASNTGGIPDLLSHGKNGLLVPPADADALAHAILNLLLNPEKALIMGLNGKRKCWNFSLDFMMEKLENLYDDLLKKRRT
ncbi:glycosyltransferase family 4 protein [Desulfobacterales bacterium HSG17]|nr:glycosyltransferase family 4 protein [Desulfobacterales bacterium HSG17]